MNAIEMRQRRAQLYAELRGLHEGAKGESRDLNDEEQGKWNTATAELDTLAGIIEREERLSSLDAEMDMRVGRPVAQQVNHGEDAPKPVFRNMGEQLVSIRDAYLHPDRTDPRLYEVRAPLGAEVGTPSEGGFLLEHQYTRQLWQMAWDQGELMRRCFRVPIDANADSVKINGIDETSRATGSRWGGVRAYWVAEGGTITASQPTFRQMSFEPKDLDVLVYATGQMLRSTSTLEAVVNQVVPEEINWMTENAIMWGTGVGMPLGFMSSGALISVDKESGQLADTIVVENISKMWARMRARNRANAVWLISQDIEPQLDQLAVVSGTASFPVYLPAGGMSAAPYGSIKGRPVVPVEHCDTLGDLGDIVLVDLSQYGLSDRGGVEAASSIHVQFLTNQQAFRFIYSVDGQSLWSSALTPWNGGATQSAFVALAARA